MSGFGALLRKELRETVHTWRLWVLPSVVAFFGLTSPVMAALLPRLLEWSERQGTGITVTVQEPVARDAYVQFVGNLLQLAALTLIVTAAGLISAELKSGSAALVLVKPIGRGAFVIGKLIAYVLVLLAATAVGTVLCLAVTVALFDPGPVGALLAAVGVWLLYALMLLCMTMLLSAALTSQLAAAAVGIGIYILLSALGTIGPLADATPAGLGALASRLVTEDAVVHALPLITAAIAALGCLGAAIAIFRRREL